MKASAETAPVARSSHRRQPLAELSSSGLTAKQRKLTLKSAAALKLKIGWMVGISIFLLIPHMDSPYELHLQPLELEDCIDPEQVGSGGVHILHVHIHRDLRPLGGFGVDQYIERYVFQHLLIF